LCAHDYTPEGNLNNCLMSNARPHYSKIYYLIESCGKIYGK
jgi:hypothetical protein